MLIIILLCFLFAFWYFWSWMKPRHPMSPPMHPGAWPIIGHAYWLIVNAQDLWRIEKYIYNYCLRNEDIIGFRIGPYPCYVLTDPDDCLTVANKCLKKPRIYRFGKEIYDRGLISANTSVWKPHRRLLSPAFNQQVLQAFVGEFIIEAKSLVAQLSCEVGTGPFDVQPYLITSMMSTACRTTFGLKMDQNKVTLKNYARAVEDLFSLYIYRAQRVWLYFPYIFNKSSYKTTENNIVKVMKDFTKAVITNRKSDLRLSCSLDETKDTESEQFRSLLDQMLDLADKQDAFSEDEIREHLDTMIAAAYDTTAITLTFALILIGSHQDVQEQIHKELQEVLGNQKRDLDRNDLPKLVYLEAVIKEALRLYPPAPRIARCSSTDVQLKKYTLPGKCTYLISVYGINRHPMWGADADQFRPERWLEPTSLPANPIAFATFSMGKRNCIGKLYALMAVKTTLAYILRAYHIKSDVEKLVMRCDVLLKPVSGHEISLESRT